MESHHILISMGLGSSCPSSVEANPAYLEAERALGEREFADLKQLFAGLATGTPPALDLRTFHGLVGGTMPSSLCERLYLAIVRPPESRLSFEDLIVAKAASRGETADRFAFSVVCGSTAQKTAGRAAIATVVAAIVLESLGAAASQAAADDAARILAARNAATSGSGRGIPPAAAFFPPDAPLLYHDDGTEHAREQRVLRAVAVEAATLATCALPEEDETSAAVPEVATAPVFADDGEPSTSGGGRGISEALFSHWLRHQPSVALRLHGLISAPNEGVMLPPILMTQGPAAQGGVQPAPLLTPALPAPLLTPALAWLCSGSLRPGLRQAWRLLYNSKQHGHSFSMLLARAGSPAYRGGTLLVVRDRQGAVFGAFLPLPLEKHRRVREGGGGYGVPSHFFGSLTTSSNPSKICVPGLTSRSGSAPLSANSLATIQR